MEFDQDNLDEFFEVIRFEGSYTLAEFKKLMVNVCVDELNTSPTHLLSNLSEISFQAGPVKEGILELENEDHYVKFAIKFDEKEITSIKLKEVINGKKWFNEKDS